EPAGPVCRANGLYSSLPSLSMGIVGLIEPGCQSKDKRSDLSPAAAEAEWIVVRKRLIRKRGLDCVVKLVAVNAVGFTNRTPWKRSRYLGNCRPELQTVQFTKFTGWMPIRSFTASRNRCFVS